MPNRKYQKGYRRERELVLMARNRGNYAARTAGSHSDWDVIEIDPKKGELNLYQVKGDKVKINYHFIPEHLEVNKYLAYKKKGKWVFEKLK